jgi:sec-independent protein translocase protein TatB
MFDIGWGKLILIGIVALIVIGPKELPGALRTLGQWVAKIRRMASEFQNQFHEAMREAELADLKKEVDEMAAQAAHFNPIEDIRQDIEKAAGPLPDLESPLPDTPTASASAPAAADAAPATDAGASIAPPAAPAPASEGTASEVTSSAVIADAAPVDADVPKVDAPKPDMSKPDAGRAA